MVSKYLLHKMLINYKEGKEFIMEKLPLYGTTLIK